MSLFPKMSQDRCSMTRLPYYYPCNTVGIGLEIYKGVGKRSLALYIGRKAKDVYRESIIDI